MSVGNENHNTWVMLNISNGRFFTGDQELNFAKEWQIIRKSSGTGNEWGDGEWVWGAPEVTKNNLD